MQSMKKLDALASAIDIRLNACDDKMLKCPNETEMVKWINALPEKELIRVLTIGALYTTGFVVPEEFYEANV